MHIFIERCPIQQPVGVVLTGRVTGEVLDVTASTLDSEYSTGTRNALQWKHLHPDPERGMLYTYYAKHLQ